MAVGHAVRRAAAGLAAAFIAAACLPGAHGVRAQETKRDAPLPHAVGQSVSPSFEGWYENPDGSFSIVFGYFNRNHEEHLDIPVGPDNRIEPGPADRGQPTHFLPRRQTGVFAVRVPPDFGERELTWSLTAHGETIAIPGSLRPEWRIDALKEVTNGNTPPALRFESGAAAGQGPAGISTRMTAAPGQPVELAVWTTDDGISRARGSIRVPPGVAWSKFRGPGTVTFSEAQPALDDAGRAVTRATFSESGEYMLRVLAWDESGAQRAVMAGGFFCCWTNGFVTVDVR
ncbi:MAG: hypothetical protein J4F30_01035 [Acidobacteria bacterium]|nr:hypothetical protein [Acidobacteriota bacterium]